MTNKASASAGIFTLLALLITGLTMLTAIDAKAQQPGVRFEHALLSQKTNPVQRESANVNFLPAMIYDGGGYNPESVVVADVNGDGKLDMIVASACQSLEVCQFGAVSVMLGNGDGTFRPPVTYLTGGSTSSFDSASLAVADVNGDGKPDLIVASSCLIGSCESGAVSVFLGNGDGTFETAATYPSGGLQATSVAVGDMNRDGKPDLVVANSCINSACPNGAVTLLLGNGDGTFRSALAYNSGGLGTMSVALADVNGDGKLDALVANYGEFVNSGNVGVLLGKGDGTFQPVTTYSVGPSPWALAVADLNKDGKPDLAVANSCWCTAGASISVLMGNGDGTFQPATTYDSGGNDTFSVAISDINGDGNLDLIAGDHCNGPGCDTVGLAGVLLGNGDGTFQPVVVFSAGVNWTNSVVSADVNGDGWPDLVLANLGSAPATVLINDTPLAKAATTTILSSSSNPSTVNQQTTFTAAVNSGTGTVPNGENVTFYNGPAVLGTSPLNGGTAILTTSSLPAGAHILSANYSGDSDFGPSASQLQQTVKSPTKFATSTSLIPTLNPSIYGQHLTFVAVVDSPGIATGQVTFTWSGYAVGEASLFGGVAVLTRPTLNADTYPLEAVYHGDANNERSTSAILNQVVQQTTSSATLTSAPNPSTAGKAVTFTAKISSPTVKATGPVTFTAGKATLGSVELINGKAMFTTSTLAAGTTTVTAAYSGDSNIAQSSASVTQTVQ
ncbi:MAG: FG-GAP-like repeat-containing protein [Candidatus Sulfotelmatobacter sp.]